MPRIRLVFAAGGALAGLISLSAPALAAANCPAWTSPICRQYSCTGPLVGGTCHCVRWACVADKKSDPPKRLQSSPTHNYPYRGTFRPTGHRHRY